jgi:hypothetical protein
MTRLTGEREGDKVCRQIKNVNEDAALDKSLSQYYKVELKRTGAKVGLSVGLREGDLVGETVGFFVGLYKK